MAATIGMGIREGRITYYAVVNGKASERGYSGPDGLRKALAEAYAIELEEILREIEDLDLAQHLDILKHVHGLTITTHTEPSFSYSYTDANGNLSLGDFSQSLDEVIEHLTTPTTNP